MKHSLHLVALGLLNLLFVGYLAAKVSAIESRLAESHVEAKAELPPIVERKTAPDIWRRVTQVAKTWTSPKSKSPEEIIKELSEVISEVDGWIYVPEDQKRADLIIQKELDLLRNLISDEIARLSKEATGANGRSASKAMSRINALVALYPSPSADEERKKLDALTGKVLATSRHIEDIRRLQYNDWAIDRIEGGLEEFYRVKKLGSISGEVRRKNYVYVSVESMSMINPAFLEPVVTDLYMYVLGLTKEEVKEDQESKVALVRGFTDPKNERKTPYNFDE